MLNKHCDEVTLSMVAMPIKRQCHSPPHVHSLHLPPCTTVLLTADRECTRCPQQARTHNIMSYRKTHVRCVLLRTTACADTGVDSVSLSALLPPASLLPRAHLTEGYGIR